MTSYKDLLAQRAELDKLIANQRKEEVAEAIKKAQALIADYDLTADDVFPPAGKKKKSAGSKVAPKYRNPEDGATWTGRGKAPLWISTTPDAERSKFLIANQ